MGAVTDNFESSLSKSIPAVEPAFEDQMRRDGQQWRYDSTHTDKKEFAYTVGRKLVFSN